MQQNGDQSFHIVMGALLGISLVVDQQEIAQWRSGQVSMISLVLAMVWLGRYAWDAIQRRDSEIKELRGRLETAEQQLNELINDARTRRRPF